MRYKENILKKKITLFLILYFMFFTLYLSANTWSKYIGRASGSGSVSIAKWEVSINSNETNEEVFLVAGSEAKEYKLSVTSTSEVANSYSIIISDIPDDIMVSLDGGEEKAPTENTIIFSDVDLFEANDINQTHEHILSFVAPLEANTLENYEIQLDVVFVQAEV